MKWFLVGFVVALVLGAAALWAAAPLDPSENPNCQAGFAKIHEDEGYEYFTLVYRCPKREA